MGITLEEATDFLPEGDFSFRPCEEAVDWDVYCCGEKDCPTQWHRVFHGLEYERTYGKLEIRLVSCDEDGNWETNAVWTEDDAWEGSDIQRHLDTNLGDHFKQWQAYYEHVLRTGEDVLGEFRIGRKRKRKQRWQVWMHRSIVGTAMARVRRYGKPETHPHLLPDDVKKYLLLKSDQLHMDLDKETMDELGLKYHRWETFTIEVEVPRNPITDATKLRAAARRALRRKP
jgi:hypothetical protein